MDLRTTNNVRNVVPRPRPSNQPSPDRAKILGPPQLFRYRSRPDTAPVGFLRPGWHRVVGVGFWVCLSRFRRVGGTTWGFRRVCGRRWRRWCRRGWRGVRGGLTDTRWRSGGRRRRFDRAPHSSMSRLDTFGHGMGTGARVPETAQDAGRTSATKRGLTSPHTGTQHRQIKRPCWLALPTPRSTLLLALRHVHETRRQHPPSGLSDRFRSGMRCAECGAEADERAEGWRAMLGLEDDDTVVTVVVCPECFEC